MAHELTVRENSFVEFAFTGDRTNIWHGLGNQLQENSTIETWQEQAGMDWTINSSPLMFTGNDDVIVDDSRRVLFRSDTEKMMSVVSKDYKIVQPKEVLEFFRDLTEANQMKLSAAGTLFGGAKFWATAELNREIEITNGDKVSGYLLLMSSCDSSTATTAKFTSVRAVCKNTLQIALNSKSRNAIKITHSKKFDPKQVKIDMGLIDVAWDSFVTNLKTLANKSMTDDAAQNFFAKLITPDNAAVDMELLRTQRHVDAMMHFYKNGAGAEMSYGTRWGALNAVTELYTHGNGKRDASHQFATSEVGTNSQIKMTALDKLLAMA